MVPKSGKSNNRCLTIPGTANQNGTNCAQGTYTNNSNYRDEWYFARVDYRMDLAIFMDQSFVSTHGGANGAQTEIDNVMKIVREKYAEYFMICINYSSATQFTSYTDLCDDYSADYCFHGLNDECDSKHHTNADTIVTNLPSFVTAVNSPKLLFLGRTICDEGSHGSMAGITYPNRDIAMVAYQILYDTTITKAYITLHELGHLFGASDERDGESHVAKCTYSDEGKNDESIKEEVEKDYVICDYCRGMIQQNAGKYS